jgi:hypothetical protein
LWLSLEVICPDAQERESFLDLRSRLEGLAMSRISEWVSLRNEETGGDGLPTGRWSVTEIYDDRVVFDWGNDPAYGETTSMPLDIAVGTEFFEVIATHRVAIEARDRAWRAAEAAEQAKWRRTEARAYADDIIAFAAGGQIETPFIDRLRTMLDAFVEHEGEIHLEEPEVEK